jgi:hypothetical protein
VSQDATGALEGKSNGTELRYFNFRTRRRVVSFTHLPLYSRRGSFWNSLADGLQQDNISPLPVIEPVLNHVSCAYFNTGAAFLTMLFQETKMRYLYTSFLLYA